MKTIETKVYSLNELDNQAKEVARNWYREGGFDYEWYDSVYEWATEAGALMGIRIDKIYFSGFYSQGDGACFEGYYQYEKGSLKNFRAANNGDTELLSIAKRLQTIQKKNFYGLLADVKQSGRYYHERCTCINVEHNYNNVYVSGDTEDEISECLRDFMQWIYTKLENEFDFLNSDEQIDDVILANEYTFTIDGNRF